MSEEALIQNMTALLDAQREAEKADPGAKQGEFTCPVCGKNALWARAERNNHLHCTCTGCGIMIVE
jgi:predicted RNA-binding Zn-ribbon protein involved in translation (DUF1610 family)